jgi:hypothetical protein
MDGSPLENFTTDRPQFATATAEALSAAPLLAEVKTAKMDELFTFIGDKKTKSTF